MAEAFEMNFKKREFLCTKLKLSIRQIENANVSEWTMGECNAQLESISTKYEKLEELQMAIMCAEETPSEFNDFMEQDMELERIFLKAKAKLCNRLAEVCNQAEASSAENDVKKQNEICDEEQIQAALEDERKQLALEEAKKQAAIIEKREHEARRAAFEKKQKIEALSGKVIEFAGGPSEWRAFSEAFHWEVHTNEAIDDELKLSVLKAVCIGKASEVIEEFELCSANYAMAWDRLRDQFDSKYEVVLFHTQKILSLSDISDLNDNSIRNFIAQSEEHLQEIGILCISLDEFIASIIISKMDGDVRKAWNEFRLKEAKFTVHSTSEASNIQARIEDFVPHFSLVLKFLQSISEKQATYASKLKQKPREASPENQSSNSASTSQIDAIPSTSQADSSPKNARQTAKSSGQASNSKANAKRPVDSKQKIDWNKVNNADLAYCTACAGSHWIQKCDKFANMPLEDRCKLREQKKLCIQCLRKYHDGQCGTESANKPCPKCSIRAFHNMFLCPTKDREMMSQKQAKKQPDWSDENQW